ncbi:putative wall-associated receptor kinase-like 11 [Pistacia vera]|uniref:putative wall-associated receptor kinase-like 11 n=1 Tax=Pistacia vera TaxID=55513 RepID=UPI001262E779|nr:putative wall-associated receptor kinase-like 11 [Pistacia vera]
MFLYLSCAGPAGLSSAILSSVIGTLSISSGAQCLHEFLKRWIANKLRQKFFKKNGGLLLQRRKSSNGGNIEFFTENELEKATDSYYENQILGQGGQGTVYKGMLEKGRIMAVKRLKQVAERVDVFNEYIHGQNENEEFPLTGYLCLRIAIEVAGALSYLHSAASMSIYRQDIKSSNILLDEKYRAKVSDIGTSRSIPVNVHNFGVVLAELLTGQKSIHSTDSEEVKDLAPYFLQKMEQNRLFEILDARVSKDDKEQEIMKFADLTRRCLDSNGRPTMRKVATELAGIRTSNGASISNQNPEEDDCVKIEITSEVEFEASSSVTDESILDNITSLCF